MTAGGLAVRVLLVAVVAALVGVAALAFSRSQETRYQAETRLSFSSSLRPELQILGAPFVRPTVDSAVFNASNAQWVTSRRVARTLAADQPGLKLTADQIADRIKAAPIAGTEIVAVRATGDSRAQAQLLARSYTATFMAWFDDRQRERARAVQRTLRERYDSLSREQRRSGTGSTLRTQISALDVLAKVGSGSPELLDSAHAFAAPEQPRTRRNVLLGVLFGLAVGIGLVSLRAQLRSPARSS
jgi:capsular polysaccharide biosynthesis protein